MYLKGWFQSENYFKEFAHSIRKEIYPKKRIRITRELKQILENENTVSVHVRRGDFKKLHNILPIEYYEKAGEMITNMVENPFFIVFSDDITYVRENMNFGLRCLYIDQKYGYEDYEELMIMSKCKHHIIANSTFSWWGAWLNGNENKTVIAPRKWFRDKIEGDTNLIPDNWIRV